MKKYIPYPLHRSNKIDAFILNWIMAYIKIAFGMQLLSFSCENFYFEFQYSVTLTVLLLAVIAGFFMAAIAAGGTSDVCWLDNGFAVSSRMEIVVIADPRDGTRSFTDCN